MCWLMTIFIVRERWKGQIFIERHVDATENSSDHWPPHSTGVEGRGGGGGQDTDQPFAFHVCN